MNVIKYLSKEVISKISAGEVIERPSFAVKELIENALDAGADTIHIEVEDAGLRSIRVSDNGQGMTKADLLISYKPHTTSKLSTAEHLVGITTLGFRGEALSSIAAISDMRIKSRVQNEVGGFQISVSNGEVEVKSVGMSKGTSVHVEKLFSSMPARKKFLKSQKTEFRHIVDVITQYALSYPSIHFTLSHNNKSVLDFPVEKSMEDRVKHIVGEDLFSSFIPLEFEDHHVRIEGYIGTPQVALKFNQKQFVFVNKRSVTDKLISLATREAYGSLLPQSSTPVFVIFLSVPVETVDVNIHPRKAHVSFTNASGVFDIVKQAVSETLSENNLTFRLSKFKYETSARLGETDSDSGAHFRKEVVAPEKKTLGTVFTKKSSFSQMAQTYILSESDGALVLFDQHAAHERVLYEDFIKMFKKKKTSGQTLPLRKPLTLTLSAADSILVDEYHDYFERLGFDIEHLSGTGMIVRSCPKVFAGRNIRKIIFDMLSDLGEIGTVSNVDVRTNRMLSFLSCRAAVKAGDPLTIKQMQTLLKQLWKSANNTTCPHGRPTHIRISISEIDGWFQR